MKTILFTGLAALVAIAGFSQTHSQVVKGNVKDAQSGFPLIGATVIILNTDPLLGGVSEIDGNFKIENVPVGRHDINVSFVGYEDKFLSSVSISSGKELVLSISLRESLHKLEEVVISAREQSKGERPNEMATVSALSFSVEETSRYAASFDDPARAALSFPGVKGGGDDILNEIVIRGNSPRGLLWRMEGIEIPNPNHFGEVGASAGGISMLSNNVIEKTDFYTGAFPAEYGNATSGVMDVSLRPGNNDTREYAFEAGILGIQASAEGPFSNEGNSSYLINYRYSTLALLEDLMNFSDGEESTIYQDLSFKLNFPGTRIGSFSIWGFGGANGQQFYADGNEILFNENWKVRSGAVGVKHLVFIDENTSIETALSLTGNKNQWTYDSLQSITYEKEDFRQASERISITARKKIGAAHTLKAGIIYSNLNFDMFSQSYYPDSETYQTDLDDDGKLGRWQGFAQWQYRASEKLEINSGVHYTYLGLERQKALEPRLGLKYELNPSHVISLGGGLHSRMETVAIYLAQTDQEGTNVQMNRDLELSKAGHLVAGYEYRGWSNLRVRAEAYYQNLWDVPVLENPDTDFGRSFSALNTTDGYTSLPLNNDGTGENYGIELMAERFLKDGYYYMFTGSLYKSSYAGADGIQRSTRFDGGYLLNVLGGKEFELKKDRVLALNSRVILQGANRTTPILINASIDEGYTVRDWRNPYSEGLNDYFRIDLGVSLKKNRPNSSTILALNIQNVTNRVNEYERYFSSETNSIQSYEQMGLLPVLSYRVLF